MRMGITVSWILFFSCKLQYSSFEAIGYYDITTNNAVLFTQVDR